MANRFKGYPNLQSDLQPDQLDSAGACIFILFDNQGIREKLPPCFLSCIQRFSFP